jgi:hypothetical protein
MMLYYRNSKLKDLSKRMIVLLGSLRFVALFLISFLLLEPVLNTEFRKVEKPVVVIAQDFSASVVLNKDSVFYKTEYLKQLEQLQEVLGDNYEVRTYSFGDHFRENFTGQFRDKQTDYGELFRELEARYAGRNLGAVVVAGDGIYNRGLNPVYASTPIKSPVFTIALGDTTVYQDLILEKVVHNKLAFLGNTFPVELVIKADRCKGKSTVATISKGSRVLFSQKIEIREDPFVMTVPAELSADVVGLQKYTVALSVIDGERNVLNNTSNFYVDVLDARQKVLIVSDAPHPDVSALKNTIELNDNYQVETFVADDFKGSPAEYNVVILHGIPSESAADDDLMSKIDNARIPVWYITGNQLRYNQINNRKLGVTIESRSGKANDVEGVTEPTFGLFTLSPELQQGISKWPAIAVPFGNFPTAPGARIFLKQKIGALKTDFPFMLFSEKEGVKSAVMIGEGIWKWKLADYAAKGNADLFSELVSKTIQYLAVRENKSFFRVNAQSFYEENEPVIIDAEVYNASYEAVNTEDVTIEIINGTGQRFPYTFSKSGSAYRLDIGMMAPGEYRYVARTKQNNKALTAEGQFTVTPLVAEITSTTANHRILYQLAKEHNGEMIYPKEISQLAKRLNAREDVRPVIYYSRKLTDLIDFWWILLIAVTLWTVEWILRKRNGAY